MVSCIDFDPGALLSKNLELVSLAKQHNWPAESGVTQLIAETEAKAAMQSTNETAPL